MMGLAFYMAAAVATASSLMAVTRRHAIHGLLYLTVAFMATSVMFFTLGAPFAAVMEIIVYAGGIMVLFVFVVMMLNMSRPSDSLDFSLGRMESWSGPAVLCALLAVAMGGAVLDSHEATGLVEITPKEVGMALYGPYVLGVELASMLLLAGLVGAYHLGRKEGETMDEEGRE